MENKIVTVILGMTALFGLISIGYLMYSILKIAKLEKKHKSVKKMPMSPPTFAVESNEFSDESELYEATVSLCCTMDIDYSFGRIQFTKIADEPSERVEFLRKETIEIGRASDVDISIEDKAVSWHHLRLSFSNCALKIQDLGTTNGTFLNGAKLAPMLVIPVSTNSIVNIGKTSFIISY